MISIKSKFIIAASIGSICSCVAVQNRFYDFGSEWQSSMVEIYGPGKYYQFQVYDFEQAEKKSPSLERILKLLQDFSPKPVECKGHYEVIEQSRSRYEGGSESILVKCK